LVLGSGWGEMAEGFAPRGEISYAEIPALGATGVEGHAGRLLWAGPEERALLIFQGRRHWYEGVGWTPVALPVYLARRWGASAMILTNAAGGIRPGLSVGDLMIVRDHINAMGVHPLVGPHDPFWGTRFPDQGRVYDPLLRRLLREAGAEVGLQMEEGVYVAVSGPTYETPAEVEAFRRWGADAVGMSTVPEAILANAAGLRVAALSCIGNLAAGRAETPLSHEDVARASAEAAPRMRAVLLEFWQRLLEYAER
jgi:purine-nucleoside phosphorylase